MITPAARTPPTWLRGTILLGVTLLVGIGIGGLATRMPARDSQTHAMDPDVLIVTLTRELSLDTAQHTKRRSTLPGAKCNRASAPRLIHRRWRLSMY
jgi:hypothetical protein